MRGNHPPGSALLSSPPRRPAVPALSFLCLPCPPILCGASWCRSSTARTPPPICRDVACAALARVSRGKPPLTCRQGREGFDDLRQLPGARDHRVEPTALQGDVVGRGAAAAAPRPGAGGEDGDQVRRHERARLAPAAADDGPPVARQHPGGTLLADEAGSEARRRHRRRPARRGSPLLGEVTSERRVLDAPARETDVEAAEGPGVRPPGVRADGGLHEPAGGQRRGGTGSEQADPSSPPQAFDPRVAGIRDQYLEAVDAGLDLAVQRNPHDEGLDEAVGSGRFPVGGGVVLNWRFKRARVCSLLFVPPSPPGSHDPGEAGTLSRRTARARTDRGTGWRKLR